MEFILSRPLLLLAIAVAVVFVLMFIFVNPNKPKKKKVIEKAIQKPTEEKKTEEKTGEEVIDKSDKEEQDELDENKSETEEKPKEETIETKQEDESVDKSSKKGKLKPEIVPVYKKETSETESLTLNNNTKVEEDENLVQRAQFVKSGNGKSKIAKFMGFSDLIEEKIPEIEVVLDNQSVQEFHENCEDCKNNIKHFDHSRRLSKMVKEDNFDDLVGMHISEKYMNINTEKHITLSDNFTEKLFDRAVKTLSNSSSKVLVDENGDTDKYENIKSDKDSMKVWIEEHKREELARLMIERDSDEIELSEEFIEHISNDIDISPKNIFIVDAIIKRKRFKRCNK